MFNQIIENLPPKDATQFKSLIKLYESRNYKKGLKAADKLLETQPNHPETLSLKSIFLYNNGKKEEGHDLGKKALNLGMKSDICWHIYGIINRSNRNYKEAVKCYKFALMIAPENTQILKDLALLQIQIRDLQGHTESRKKLLEQKESLVGNWVGYAVSEHLNGNYENAVKIIESVEKITAQNQLKQHEKSEIHIYTAFIHYEGGKYEESIKVLENKKDDILDKQTYFELMIDNYIGLKDFERAENYAIQLNSIGSNNRRFHEKLIQVLKLKDDKSSTISILEDLLSKNPYSQTLKLSILHECDVSVFEKKFQEYIIPYFRRSQPSLFREIQKFYTTQQQQKIDIIQKVLLDNLKSLESSQKLVGEEQVETPNVLLWNLMLLAQHYDKIGNTDVALQYINRAIEHTPTLLELYLVKAKIYKHRFNYKEAFKWADKARSIDLADRYLNNKAIKYALRLNDTEEADALMRLFLRDPNDGNAYDLQTIWFEIAMGNAHLRKKEIGAALKQFDFIQKHYSDMYEDQFDFHVYCMRKYTLKTYIEMIRYEDKLHDSKFYVNAAVPQIRTLMNYVKVISKKDQEAAEEEEIMKNMNSKEKKAYKKKKEMAEQKKLKQQKQQEENKPAEQTEVNKVLQEYRDKLDLDGKQILEKLTNPLEQANEVAEKLINIDISTPKYAFYAYQTLVDLYILRKKELLCIKALNKLIKSNYDVNQIHVSKVKAIKFLQEAFEGLEGTVKETVQEELQKLTEGKTIEQLNAAFLETLKDNQIYQQYYTFKVDQALDQLKIQQFSEKIESLLQNGNITIQQAIFIYDDALLQGAEIQQVVKDNLTKQFPESDYFCVRTSIKADREQNKAK